MDKRVELVNKMTCDELKFKVKHCNDCSINVHEKIEDRLHDDC